MHEMYDPDNPDCPHNSQPVICHALECEVNSGLHHVTAMYHCGLFCDAHAEELIKVSATGRITEENFVYDGS